MSKTPETDANCWREGVSEWVAANFARNLERERDEARDLSAALQLKCNMMQAALDDWDNAVKHVEADHADEVHCGCVPVLRKLLTEARDTVICLRRQRAIARNFGKQIERERDAYRRAVELIAEDCEAWLNSESDEPSCDFIKLVAKYAREALQ
jgi:hypothetical protein